MSTVARVGSLAATRGGIYRPPANYSILVHNLKRGGFRFAHARMVFSAGIWFGAEAETGSQPQTCSSWVITWDAHISLHPRRGCKS